MSVFEELQPLLLEAIPRTVAALEIDEPIAIVRIYYYDTHAPHTFLTIRVITEVERAEAVENDGRDVPFTLWSSGEEYGERSEELPADPPRDETEDKIKELFVRVYELLGDFSQDHMVLQRDMLQQVAKKLNEQKWSLPTTDDFVVVPADRDEHFGGCDDEELAACVSPKRLKLLRKRGYLGPEDQWSKLPADQDDD